jgi:hypothetical protein
LSKRFTDSNKWDDPWYRKLPNIMKLAWQFILDKCDNIGVWKKDFEILNFYLQQEITENDFIKYFNGRIYIIDNEKIWITKFIDFQYGILDEENNSKPIQSYINALKKMKLYDIYKGYIKGMDTAKEKEKEKVKEKEKEMPVDQFIKSKKRLNNIVNKLCKGIDK